MATYPPPTEILPIFTPNVFQSADTEGLTQSKADLLYLKFPNAQGTENLVATNISGALNVIGTASFTNAAPPTSTATQPASNDSTTKIPTTAWVQTAVGAGSNILPLNNVFTGTNEFQSTVQFDSALIVSNGNQNTSLGNGFLPLASGQGTQNVFVGVGAGLSALCGGGNTVCGYFAASQGMNATASYNTLYGERAGQYLTSGVGNTCIGATNCNNNTSGNSNICLGYGAMAGESSGSLSNNIVIGNGVQSGASNRIILGDGTQTSMDLQVIPTALGGGVIRMNNNLSMNNTTAIANRQISSSYYNFYATNNVASLTYSGRFYGNLNSIVYDCPDINAVGSSSHVFYNYNNASVLNSLTISNTGITNNTTQPASNDSSTIVPTTAWVQSAISAGSGATTTTLKYTSNTTFNTPTGCRFIDIQVIGAGGSQGVSDVGPPVFYGGAGSGGNMASITGFAITANTPITITFVAGDTTGYVEISYTGASVLTNIAKVFNGNGGQAGSIGSPAAGATSNSTASIINSRSASAYVYAGTAGLGSTLTGGGSSVPPATAGTGTSCPNGVFTYSNGVFGCGGTGNINKGGGLVVITYHLGV